MRKKTHPLLIKEANRYFRGSIDDKDKLYKSRMYNNGLAVTKKDGKYKFYKQAKMCDSALIY